MAILVSALGSENMVFIEWLPPEDVEGLDFENLADSDIAGDSGNEQDHAEGQSQVPERNHRCVVGQPVAGD